MRKKSLVMHLCNFLRVYLKIGSFFLLFSLNAIASKKIITENKIWESNEWKRLLHSETSIFGDLSEADSQSFFLAPNGRRDFKAELFALYDQTKNLANIDNKHAICRFPARTKWLFEKLSKNLDTSLFKKCTDLNKYLILVDSEKVSLVFSSYYLESPASAFGHTLLKLSRKRTDFYQETELLDVGINYAAEVTTENPVLYALFGLIGVFDGKYNAIPYFYKVREYNDFETRDLWSYELNLTSEQHQRMLDHLWEVGNANFNYFYFSENCSYNLLTLLEVADFSLDLTSRLPTLYTVPSHTIQIVNEVPGLVSKVSVAPSLRQRFDFNFNRLPIFEQDLLLKAYKERNLEVLGEMQNNTLLIDTLITYIDFLNAKEVLLGTGEISKWKKKILLHRSKLGKNSLELTNITDLKSAPQLGHAPARFGIGYVDRNYDDQNLSGVQLQHRMPLHSFMDNPVGQPKYSRLEFLDVTMSFLKNGTLLIDELDLVDVMALNPITRYKIPYSLKAKIGWNRDSTRCSYCSVFSVYTAGGASIEKDKTLFYGFVGLVTESSTEIKEYTQFNIRPEAGLRHLLNDKFAIKFNLSSDYLLESDQNFTQGEIDFNFYRNDNERLQMKFLGREKRNKQINLNYYFYY